MHFFENLNFGSVPFAHLTVTVWLLIALALAFDFLNGFHDAANSIATVVSTRVLTPRAAVIWAGHSSTSSHFCCSISTWPPQWVRASLIRTSWITA